MFCCLILSLFFVSVDTQSNILTCEEGTTWIREHVNFRCLEPDSRGFQPYECLSPKNAIVQPGKELKEDKFQFECRQDDPMTIVWEVVFCFTPSGTELGVGGEVEEDNGIYSCYRDPVTKDVSRKFIGKTTCDFKGKTLKLDEKTVDGEGLYTCTYFKDNLQVVAYGCRMPDGKDVGPYITYKGKICEIDYPPKTPKGYLRPLPVQCTDPTGTRRDIAEKFELNNVEYVCDVKRGVPIPKLTDEYLEIKPRACFKTVAGKRLKIFINQAKKAPDGSFLWCKPKGTGVGDTTYATEPIPADKAKCGKRKLLSFWVADNTFCKCAWNRGGNAEARCFMCVSNNRKQVSKNRIYEEGKGKAFICLPNGPHKLVYQRLTPQEYDFWKKGYRIIGDVGYPGSGLAWRDKTGKLICADGFVDQDNTCIDENECEMLTDTCGEFERCENEIGGFTCHCKYGFARNVFEKSCLDVSCGC